MPASAVRLRRVPSKVNGVVTTPRASAHPRGDEAHVAALEHAIDRLDRFFRGRFARHRHRACTEPSRDIGPELNRVRRKGRGQRLRVGVGNDELNARNVAGDHVRDGIAAGAPDPDDDDTRTQFVRAQGLQLNHDDLLRPRCEARVAAKACR
jgi:hypothetical protein